MANKNNSVISKEQVNQLTEILAKLNISANIKSSSTQSVFEGIMQALSKLVEEKEKIGEQWQDTKGVKGVKEEMKKMKKEQRNLEDSVDAVKQRNLKGNIIINSHSNETKKVESLLLDDDNLEEKKMSVLDHVSDLIQEHYEVTIPASDVAACHRLKKGGVLIRFWNRKNGSAYQKLVSAIKCGGKFGKERKEGRVSRTSFNKKPPNMFCCFHLTKKRADIIKHLKALKKAGKIWSFQSNQNGMIYMKATETGPKTALTKDWDDGSESLTYSPEEIDRLLH